MSGVISSDDVDVSGCWIAFEFARIDDVRNTWSSRITLLDCSADFGYKKVYIIF